MRSKFSRLVAPMGALALLAGCAEQNGESKPKASAAKPAIPAEIKPVVHVVKPGPNAQKEAQTALIKVKPGEIVEFSDGKFDFTAQLSLTVPNVIVRGKGMDKTILNFKGQTQGSEGFLAKADKFTIEDLAIEDTKGDCLKVEGATGVTFRNVRVEWTNEGKETNGAYGLYPVQCTDVLMEGCVAIAAADAGIYVGQSKNIIVRRCRAERNVAGIEIENSIGADVYENVATNNTGGLLIFDLPGLQHKVKNGRQVRAFANKVYSNNHVNFAPKGNIVATVPPGTGMMVMATKNVDLYDNDIKDNQSFNLAVISYLSVQRPHEDKEYHPTSEGVYIHDNRFSGGGKKPSGAFGTLLAGLVGSPLPDIVYDGIVDRSKLVNGKLPSDLGIYIKNNGDATFVNANLGDTTGKLKPSRDLKPFEGELPPLPVIKIAGVN